MIFNVAIINTEWKKNFNQATQTITSLDIKRSLNTGCRLRRSFEKLVHDNTTSTSRLKEQGARIKSSKLAGVKTETLTFLRLKVLSKAQIVLVLFYLILVPQCMNTTLIHPVFELHYLPSLQYWKG